jgi:dUTP pyrophosphatase
VAKGWPSPLLDVEVVQLPCAEGLPLPAYETNQAAGMDLRAAHDIEIPPHFTREIRTGLCVAIPAGYEGTVRSRSGLARKSGIRVMHGVGTIDADYRGELVVMLTNQGAHPFQVTRGDRIAQLVVSPVVRASVVPVAALPETARGEGGFGSTGSN